MTHRDDQVIHDRFIVNVPFCLNSFFTINLVNDFTIRRSASALSASDGLLAVHPPHHQTQIC